MPLFTGVVESVPARLEVRDEALEPPLEGDVKSMKIVLLFSINNKN